MATSGLYGSSPTGAVISAPGSESAGLYGNGTTFGGSYFEWFIFIQADTQPATPTGGSWSFSTNSGTPPTGWSSTPPAAPTLPVWVSIALVNSKNASTLEWSAPGVFSYSSGLPILSGTGSPTSGDGLNNQLWIQTGTTPETIWFKQSGTWVRLSGSTLYVDTSSNQTVGGTKTFSNVIVGSVSGTANNVTGIVSITNGGTGQTSANSAFNALAPSQTGNSGKFLTTDGTDTSWSTNPLGTVTSVAVSGGTTGLTTSGGPITTSGTITLAGTLAVANGGTGATTANGALTNLGGIGDITSTDGSVTITPTGTSRDLSVAVAAATNNVICQVRNATGATLTKGTVVYISGGTGQLPTVSKALATTDATSAQTLGMMTADLANNSNGNVTIIGLITNIDTSAYTDGQQLYLSGTTAGTVTATKPYAPIHLVYVAVVEHAHPTQGKLFVKVQNGYELDELHNVSAQSPTTGQTIVYNSATTLWEKNTVSLTAGVNGTLPIANGGTGQTTANAAFNALAPSQTGNSGKYLTTDGSNTSWATNPLGTVTSVSGTGTVNGLTLTGTVTTSGSLTLGGTLSGIANSALTNSSITIGGTTIALGGSSNALANDITVYGLTVGRGAGAISTNAVVGSNALSSNTAGTYNTAVGTSAGAANTTGIQSVFIGGLAGFTNTTGSITAIGYAALAYNTTGTRNVAVGHNDGTGYGAALQSNTTGGSNTAVGVSALTSNTTGSYNTAIGQQALVANTTASLNTAVGYQAGYSNVTGTRVTFVGNSAGFNSTADQNTAVGYSALFATSTGTYNSAVGDTSLYANTTGSNNTALGFASLRFNTTASNNTAVGYQAAYSNVTGTKIAAVGYKAAYAATGGDVYATALGSEAMTSTTTGSEVTAIGANALYFNTTGSYNTALGSQAAIFNTTGSNNAALSYKALYSNTTGTNNVAVGYQAGYSNTTATYNTFVGSWAGYSVTTGNSNTFIGAQSAGGVGAGYSMTTGSKNTIIGGFTGNQSGVDIRALSNYIVLSDGDGYPAFWGQGGSSGYMRLEAGRLEFPATQNASSNANTLDDYEEGTWTPTIAGVTPSAALGNYTKVGNLVHFWGRVTTGSGNSTAARIGGLPFTTSANSRSGMTVSQANLCNYGTGATTLVGFINSNYIDLFGNVNNGAYITTPTSWFSGGGGSFIEFSGTYLIF